MVFAIDFDGTLCYSSWPECGPANEELITFLKKRRQLGDKLILWTCRENKELEKAVIWCTEQGLEFDAVNDNLPEAKEKYGDSRKIGCDYYIDDRALSADMYKLFEGVM